MYSAGTNHCHAVAVMKVPLSRPDLALLNHPIKHTYHRPFTMKNQPHTPPARNSGSDITPNRGIKRIPRTAHPCNLCLVRAGRRTSSGFAWPIRPTIPIYCKKARQTLLGISLVCHVPTHEIRCMGPMNLAHLLLACILLNVSCTHAAEAFSSISSLSKSSSSTGL